MDEQKPPIKLFTWQRIAVIIIAAISGFGLAVYVICTKQKNLSILLDRVGGIISILGGIYGLLLVYRVLPVNPKDPDRSELWHRKFDKMMKIVCPIVIVFGMLLVLGLLS